LRQHLSRAGAFIELIILLKCQRTLYTNIKLFTSFEKHGRRAE
jgi:hypothetical protein